MLQAGPLTRLILLAVLALAMPTDRAVAERALRIGGTGTLHGLVKMLIEAYRPSHPTATFEAPRSLGSSGGINAMLAGALDIASSSRPPTGSERKAGAVATPIGSSPFVFVTSHPSFRSSIDSADVIAMFTRGRITWPDGMPIRPVLRPEQDSDTAYLVAQFPGLAAGLDAIRRQQVIPVALTDQNNLDQAETLQGSFAGTSLVTVLSEHRRVAILPFEGVEPSLDALRRGRYRLTRALYFVTSADPSPAVRAFLAFVASPAGAQVLGRAGVQPAAGAP